MTEPSTFESNRTARGTGLDGAVVEFQRNARAGKNPDIIAGPGIYLLNDASSREICYIGQSGNCAKRLLDHSKKSWDERELQFSFHGIDKTILQHQLKELENDLIGNFFEMNQKAPEYQFRNSQ